MKVYLYFIILLFLASCGTFGVKGENYYRHLHPEQPFCKKGVIHTHKYVALNHIHIHAMTNYCKKNKPPSVIPMRK